MNKRDLEKLSKSELIKMLLKQKKSKPKVVIVDDTKPTRPGWVRNPNTNRWIKIDGPTYRRLYPMQHVLNEQKTKIDLLKNNHLISIKNIRA